MTVLSIYPVLIVLALIVGVYWLFAIPRFTQRFRRMKAISIGIIALTLAVENSFYFMCRIMSTDEFVEMSNMEVPVGAMKLFYIVGLIAALLAFGEIQ